MLSFLKKGGINHCLHSKNSWHAHLTWKNKFLIKCSTCGCTTKCCCFSLYFSFSTCRSCRLFGQFSSPVPLISNNYEQKSRKASKQVLLKKQNQKLFFFCINILENISEEFMPIGMDLGLVLEKSRKFRSLLLRC